MMEGGGLQDRALVLALSELAEQIVKNTTLKSFDDMDILSYVTIKRLPGGSIGDSHSVRRRDILQEKLQTDISGCHLARFGEPL